MAALRQTKMRQSRVLFRLGSEVHEVEAERVVEVIAVPHVTRVPHGPPALCGIANLRGQPLPVVSVAELLGAEAGGKTRSGKVIVCDFGGSVGLLVDDVLRLSDENVTTTEPLALHELLQRALKLEKPAGMAQVAKAETAAAAVTREALRTFLSFWVAGQLYGLPLAGVREVTTLSEELAARPDTGDAIRGMMPLRGSVVPVVSLAALLGLQQNSSQGRGVSAGSGNRVIVIEHEDGLVGLIVAGLEMIRRLPERAIGPVPAVLQKGRGTAELDAIGRIDEDSLLISILSPAKLFGHVAVSQAVGRNAGASIMTGTSESTKALERFLLFRLADETYGLPVSAVDEVIRVPGDVTRMPGAPSFVTGVINMRGRVIPLIDQRTRFHVTEGATGSHARAIVVTIGELQAGFIVDSVAEVKAVPAESLSVTPEFSSAETGIFDRVAHFEAEGQMVLIVNPQELLSRAERDVITSLAQDSSAVKPT